jgi:hypothetical protein
VHVGGPTGQSTASCDVVYAGVQRGGEGHSARPGPTASRAYRRKGKPATLRQTAFRILLPDGTDAPTGPAGAPQAGSVVVHRTKRPLGTVPAIDVVNAAAGAVVVRGDLRNIVRPAALISVTCGTSAQPRVLRRSRRGKHRIVRVAVELSPAVPPPRSPVGAAARIRPRLDSGGASIERWQSAGLSRSTGAQATCACSCCGRRRDVRCVGARRDRRGGAAC